MKFRILIFLIVILGLNACSIHRPATPDEYRSDVLAHSWAFNISEWSVNRPYSSVVKTFRERSAACLNVEVTNSSMQHSASGDWSSGSSTRVYKSTMDIGKDMATLSLRFEVTAGNEYMVGDKPEGGYFSQLVDITPEGRKTAHIKVYGENSVNDRMMKAFKGWSKGSNLACPF